MKYKLAIFDLDGTILDTLKDLTSATNYAMRINNFPTRTIEEVRQFVGNGIYMLIRRAVPAEIDDDRVKDVTKQFADYYKQHCSDKTKPYEGIVEMLKELRKKGLKTAVVSNKADFAVKILISDYFPDLFDESVGEKENVRKKPFPDSVNEVLKQLNISKDDAVYIGDSEVDIQTANNAGMDCISVSYGFRDANFLRANNAQKIVNNVNDLYKEIIGE